MLPDPYRGIWGGSNCRDSIVQVTSTSVLFWCPQFRVLCVIPLRAYLRRRIANAAALLAAARPTSVIWSSWTRLLTIAHRTLVLAASSPSRFRFEFISNYICIGESLCFHYAKLCFVGWVQGFNNSVQYPRDFLKRTFEKVRSMGGVCISDEVQTGFGRTGSNYWGFESAGVVPDIGILCSLCLCT